jgi:hypothetical protein
MIWEMLSLIPIRRDTMPSISFAGQIRPLFRDFDVESMKSKGLDLSSYDSVKKLAPKVYGVLSAGRMPCDGKWSADNLAKFKEWMDSGMKP